MDPNNFDPIARKDNCTGSRPLKNRDRLARKNGSVLLHTSDPVTHFPGKVQPRRMSVISLIRHSHLQDAKVRRNLEFHTGNTERLINRQLKSQGISVAGFVKTSSWLEASWTSRGFKPGSSLRNVAMQKSVQCAIPKKNVNLNVECEFWIKYANLEISSL